MSKELVKKISDLEKEIRIRWENHEYFLKRDDYEGVELMKKSIDDFNKQLEATKKELNDYDVSKKKGLKPTELKNIINMIEYHNIPIKEVTSVRNILSKRYISVKLDDVFFHAANYNERLYDYVIDWINNKYLKDDVQ